MDILLYGVLALLTATLLAAGFRDVTRYTLPNEISYMVLGLFAVTALVQFSLPVLLSHLASGTVIFAITYVAWRIGAMGGGDVKLWAATACWFEIAHLPKQAFAVALAGGALALGLLTLRRGLAFYGRTAGRPEFEAQLPRGLRQGGPVPYGLAIAAGTLWALFTSAPGYFAAVLPPA